MESEHRSPASPATLLPKKKNVALAPIAQGKASTWAHAAAGLLGAWTRSENSLT
jgi:hypothetical protein